MPTQPNPGVRTCLRCDRPLFDDHAHYCSVCADVPEPRYELDPHTQNESQREHQDKQSRGYA